MPWNRRRARLNEIQLQRTNQHPNSCSCASNSETRRATPATSGSINSPKRLDAECEHLAELVPSEGRSPSLSIDTSTEIGL